MMVPVLYCTCIMAIMAATFVLFVALRLWQHGVQKRPFRAHAKETQDAEEVGLPCCAIQIIAAREPLYLGFSSTVLVHEVRHVGYLQQMPV